MTSCVQGVTMIMHNVPPPMDLHDLHSALSMIHTIMHNVSPVLLNKRTVVVFWHRSGYARTPRWQYLTCLSLNHFSSVAVDDKWFHSLGLVWIMGWYRKSTRYLLRHCWIACTFVCLYYSGPKIIYNFTYYLQSYVHQYINFGEFCYGWLQTYTFAGAIFYKIKSKWICISIRIAESGRSLSPRKFHVKDTG